MNEIVKPAMVLLIVTAIAGALLGAVQNVTAEPIAKTKAAAEAAAMKEALPMAETFEELDVELTGTISKVSVGKDGSGAEVGYVVIANPAGFGGACPTTVGIDLTGVIAGVAVKTPAETPGLGSLAVEPEFTSTFNGLSGEVAITKDGGTVLTITSATITSRAIADGVNETLAWFSANGGAN